MFLKNGAEPPEWQDTSLPDEKPGTVPPKPVDDLDQAIASFHNLRMVPGETKKTSGLGPFFSLDGIFNNGPGVGETRLNKATYDFIRNECLFSRQGLLRYAKAFVDKKKLPIKFPVESIEVKAAWLDLEKEKIPQERWGTYYTAEYTAKLTSEGASIPEGEQKKKTYGLVVLHIITKDIPNWFWASFHHKDTPHNRHEPGDAYGQPKILAGTVWENYVLGGTQTDFVQPTGGVTRLSDHYVEFGFQRSSCITCHANATISPTGPMRQAQEKALCAMTPDLPDVGLPPEVCKKILGEDAFKPGTDELRFERGVPDPLWFQVDGKPYYLQTDFVWSFALRANKNDEAGPPPARCIW